MSNSAWLCRVASLALALIVMATPAFAQKQFPTPEAAAAALNAATARFDEPALRDLFGPAYDRIKSADTAQLRQNVEGVHKAISEYAAIRTDGPDRATIVIGFEGWPFPVPLARQADAWQFDTAVGAEEILNRRIGANELKAIELLQAYVGAQREYASRPRNEGPLRAFAQKIRSTPGKKDGLYWPAGPGQEQSPFGPLIPDAARREPGQPYYGYYYRILTAQGRDAPGGAYSYIINRNMVAGFAMIAYPAAYGNTGVMTFIVNHYGDVYQKDLGVDTVAFAKAIQEYNPDSSWRPVDNR